MSDIALAPEALPHADSAARTAALARLRRADRADRDLFRRRGAGGDLARSPACTCTNSCTTAATCSASPATEGMHHGQNFPDPRHDLRHRRRLAGVRLRTHSSASPRSTAPSASKTRSPRPPAKCRSLSWSAATCSRAGGCSPASWSILIAIGGLFSLLFAFAWGRLGRLGHAASAALLAGASFVAIYLVPFLKYPANPPSVGNPDTIRYRTALYFGMIVISIVAMVAAVNLGASLDPPLGLWHAALAGGAAYPRADRWWPMW